MLSGSEVESALGGCFKFVLFFIALLLVGGVFAGYLIGHESARPPVTVEEPKKIIYP